MEVLKKITMVKLIFLFFYSCYIQANASETAAYDFDQHQVKTALEIKSPNSNTIWVAPDEVALEWSTLNMDSEKTIQFYLSKDDMVVQDLGIFKNTNITHIKLDKSLPAGTNYRVIGIELFPEDKFNIAKYATALFTIKKAPITKNKIGKEISDSPKKTAPPLRSSFEGRSIKYVDVLNVESENISINVWDHGRKDGDVVSIFLNGEAVVSNYLLDYKKKVYEVKLNPSKPNDLFLYAHNLGKFPPNTVSIEIIDGKVAKNIVLNSDLKSCEAVVINVQK